MEKTTKKQIELRGTKRITLGLAILMTVTVIFSILAFIGNFLLGDIISTFTKVEGVVLGICYLFIAVFLYKANSQLKNNELPKLTGYVTLIVVEMYELCVSLFSNNGLFVYQLISIALLGTLAAIAIFKIYQKESRETNGKVIVQK